MLHHVRAIALTSYPEVAAFVGLHSNDMLRRARISPDIIANRDERIPAQAMCKLLEDSARASGCMTFGLAMAQCRTFTSLGPIGLLLQHLGSVVDAVRALTEYRRHLNDVVNLRVHKSDPDPLTRIELMANFATPQAADLALGLAYVALSGASRLRWQPLAVHFTHKAPGDGVAYRRFFGAPVEFQSSFNGFTCNGEALGAKWSWANDSAAEDARALLSLVQPAPDHAPVSQKVMRVIALLLPSGRATLLEVAAQIRKSPRSLQRDLAREGHSFGGVLNDVRRSLVIQQLSRSGMPLNVVATMLGYFSSSSFSRWFIAEFGAPPRVWRDEQRRAIACNVL